MAKPFQDAIVLFGDSITQEWAAGSLAHRFSAAYSRRLDVLNRGFGGYTSEWNLPIFELAFAKKDEQENLPAVKLVTIWLGANDSTFPNRQQHLPLPRYEENIRHYVDSLLLPESQYYQPQARVLLLTPPPINEKMREEAKLVYPVEERTPADRSLANTKQYRDAILQIVQDFKRMHSSEGEKLEAIDTWRLIIDAAGGDEGDQQATRPFFTDGLHLTSKAYGIVFDECLAVVTTKFSGLDPENQDTLPMTVPHWADIDPKDSRNCVLRIRAMPQHQEL